MWARHPAPKMIASFSGAIIERPGAMAPSRAPAETDRAGPPIPQYRFNPDAVIKNVPGLSEAIKDKLRILYLSCGLDDGLITFNKQFEDWLEAHGIHFAHEEVPGYAHVWSFWRRSLVKVAPQLFRTPQNLAKMSGK